MIGMLPEYKRPPTLYCMKQKFYCDAYRDDPCDNCPHNASKQTITSDETRDRNQPIGHSPVYDIDEE